MKRSIKGFTLVEIMIVVAIIGILIAIAVPGFIKARKTSQGRACSENLSKIDGAKEQYALENNLDENTTPTEGDLWDNSGGGTGYLKTNAFNCPSNGGITINPIGTDPACDKIDATNNLHILPTN